MKKHIAILLCTAVLTLGLTAAPAMASAGPYSPIEVEAYTYGPLDEPRVNKVYRLSVTDDPSGIPTEDFERGGQRYYLLDMIADSDDPEVVIYTVIFGSEELTRDEKHAKASGQSGPQAPFADFAKMNDGPDLLPILGCAGGVIIAAVIIFCAIKAKQRTASMRSGPVSHKKESRSVAAPALRKGG